jgi:hypothetical protein
MMKAGRYYPKTPKLEEAHKIICGFDFENAHDAMADVAATVRILRCLRDEHGVDIRGDFPKGNKSPAEPEKPKAGPSGTAEPVPDDDVRVF